MQYTNNCTLIQYALSYINIHQCVSVAFATIIRVAYKNSDEIELPKLHN
jgi:hypothetical protein